MSSNKRCTLTGLLRSISTIQSKKVCCITGQDLNLGHLNGQRATRLQCAPLTLTSTLCPAHAGLLRATVTLDVMTEWREIRDLMAVNAFLILNSRVYSQKGLAKRTLNSHWWINGSIQSLILVLSLGRSPRNWSRCQRTGLSASQRMSVTLQTWIFSLANASPGQTVWSIVSMGYFILPTGVNASLGTSIGVSSPNGPPMKTSWPQNSSSIRAIELVISFL